MNGIYRGPPPLPHALWKSWSSEALFRHDRAGLAGVAILAAAFMSLLCAVAVAAVRAARSGWSRSRGIAT